MTKKKLVAQTAIVAMLAMLLNNCAATPESCRVEQDTTGRGILIGAVGGAAAGGLAAALGHQNNSKAAVIVVGAALVGAFVGSVIAHERDKACHELALKQALNQAIAQNIELQRLRDEAERKAAEDEAQRRTATQMSGNSTPRRSTSTQSVTPVSHTPTTPPPEKPEYMTVAWANQVTRNSGTIKPLEQVSDANAKEVCMTFADTQTVDGQTKTVVGKACRGSDGDWRPS
jgi:surface antigen